MKNLLLTVILLCFCLPFVKAADQKMILISTNETDLILQVAPNGRLYQTYLGNKLVNESEFENLSWNIQAGTDGSVSTRGWEVYPCSGAEDYFEPAFAIQHNDGNMTSIFKYVSSESKKLDNNVTETIISLKDDVYPVEAKLHYVTFAKENVIKAWTEIRHMEKKPVTITQYASNMLYFESPRYVLTEFAIALEDAPSGIRSAAAAGMRPVMIPDLVEPDEAVLELVWRRFDTLYDVIDLLESDFQNS